MHNHIPVKKKNLLMDHTLHKVKDSTNESIHQAKVHDEDIQTLKKHQKLIH